MPAPADHQQVRIQGGSRADNASGSIAYLYVHVPIGFRCFLDLLQPLTRPGHQGPAPARIEMPPQDLLEDRRHMHQRDTGAQLVSEIGSPGDRLHALRSKIHSADDVFYPGGKMAAPPRLSRPECRHRGAPWP